MKKTTLVVMLMAVVGLSMAAERKPLRQVSVDEMIVDCQPGVSNVSDDHIAIVWWVPVEYWAVFFERDTDMSEADKNEILGVLRNVSLLAVVEADIGPFGGLDFYSKLKVQDRMTISYRNAAGQRQRMLPMKNVDPDLQMVLEMLQTIMTGAMGEMGKSMHFYVLDDQSGLSSRMIDPYKSGELTVQFAGENNRIMTASLEMPLNSLYVPRKCPNGRNAHISWKYCPWSGTKLGE